MRQSHAPIAAALVAATAINAAAIAETRKAPAVAVVFIMYASAAHGGTVQHISMAKYHAATVKQAMADCERERARIIGGYAKEDLKPLIDPRCSEQKPWAWIGN